MLNLLLETLLKNYEIFFFFCQAATVNEVTGVKKQYEFSNTGGETDTALRVSRDKNQQTLGKWLSLL